MSLSRRRRYAPLVAYFAVFLLAALAIRLTLSPSFDPARFRVFFQLLVGVTVIAALRVRIGLSSFGLFGPVIVAFTLVFLGPLWGLLVFLNVFVAALATRIVLGRYRMPVTRRLAALVITVAVTVPALYVFADLGATTDAGAATVFFPAIITAWYADRYATSVEERGPVVPSIRLVWTVLAIVLTWAAMVFDPVVRFVATTPESWVALVGVQVVLGLTGGTRVREYERFRRIYQQTGDGFTHRLAIRIHNLTAGVIDPLPYVEMSRRSLPEESVLTMTERNRDYVNRYNPRHLFPSHDKVFVKRAMHTLGIPTPETYALVADADDIDAAQRVIEERDRFVVKPNDALGGEGIIVVRGREGDEYQTNRGPMSARDLIEHVESIVGGRYADADDAHGTAILEALVTPDPFLADLATDGIPDIRVVVLKGFPVMAMTRLPTAESAGTANLHKGALGAGIRLDSGRVLQPYQQSTDRWLDNHPDTGARIEGTEIPDWSSVLDLAVRAAATSRLGYAGVDIVFDGDRGPVVLEVNKRPGLGIQNANLDGLRKRLRFIETLAPDREFLPAAQKVAVSRALAAANWEGDADDLASAALAEVDDAN